MFRVIKRTLIAMVFLNTHNISFGCEIRKLIFDYTHLSGAMTGVMESVLLKAFKWVMS